MLLPPLFHILITVLYCKQLFMPRQVEAEHAGTYYANEAWRQTINKLAHRYRYSHWVLECLDVVYSAANGDHQSTQTQRPHARCVLFDIRGPIFEKSYDELMKKSDLRKTQDEHVIIKKSYNNLMKNLWRSYAKLMINLRRHYRYLTKT